MALNGGAGPFGLLGDMHYYSTGLAKSAGKKPAFRWPRSGQRKK